MCQRHGRSKRKDKSCMPCISVNKKCKQCPEHHPGRSEQPDSANSRLLFRHMVLKRPESLNCSQPAEQFIAFPNPVFIQYPCKFPDSHHFCFSMHGDSKSRQQKKKRQKQNFSHAHPAFQPLVQIVIAHGIEQYQNSPQRHSVQQKFLHQKSCHPCCQCPQYPAMYI